MLSIKLFTSRQIYLVLIFGAWFSLSGYLIKQNYIDISRAHTIASLATGIKDIPSDSEWMNIYHNGKKMGYSLYSLSNMGDEGYGISSTTKLRPVIAGMNADVSLSNRVKVDTLFRLKSFDFRLISEQISTQIEGVREGADLKLTIHQGKEITTQTLSLPEDVYTYLGLQPMVAWQGIKAGDHIKVPSFDPVSMDMGEMEIIHEGKDDITIEGVEYRLNKIRVEFRGIPSMFWLDDNGLTYREQSVLGLVMERTTPANALKFSDETVDLIDAYAIPVDKPIDDRERLTELVLELEGLDSSYLASMESERQQIISADPLQLRLKPHDISMTDEPLAPYLVATPILQSSHPRILSMARTVTDETTDQIEKVNALTDWVFQYLKKQPVVSMGSAVDILDGKAGDCSEHTTLYTALSRSIGIPTKMNIGIVYLQGRFLYHAWPSVFIDGEWIAVDPSLGQHRADATHIVFMEGDFSQITQLVPVLGKIQIKILEQHYPEDS